MSITSRPSFPTVTGRCGRLLATGLAFVFDAGLIALGTYACPCKTVLHCAIDLSSLCRGRRIGGRWSKSELVRKKVVGMVRAYDTEEKCFSILKNIRLGMELGPVASRAL